VRFGGSERTRPRRRPTHHTRERRTISWTVIEQRLARDDGASRFSSRSPSAIREIESLPDHPLEQERNNTGATDNMLARATRLGWRSSWSGSNATRRRTGRRLLATSTRSPSKSSRTVCSRNAASIAATIRSGPGWTRSSAASSVLNAGRRQKTCGSTRPRMGPRATRAEERAASTTPYDLSQTATRR